MPTTKQGTISERKTVKLGNICRIKTGNTNAEDAIADGAYPLFDRSTVIKRSDKFLFDAEAVIIPGEGKEFVPRYYSGKFDLHQRAYALTALAPHAIDVKFLYYNILQNKSYLAKAATGSTVKSLRMPIIGNMEVVLPPLPEQKRIASILSAYDDLIENNTRRIKILEEVAQALYKEWFVDFKFPGHEKVKLIDSHTECGKIPEGWEVRRLGDCVENFDSKRKPLSSMVRSKINGDIPYYGAAKVIDYVDKPIFDGKYLLVAEDGSVITTDGWPVLQFVNEKFWVSNHAHVLRGKAISTEHLYLSLRQYPIARYITGAAQPKVTQANMNAILVVVPDEAVELLFSKIVIPQFEAWFKYKETVADTIAMRNEMIESLIK